MMSRHNHAWRKGLLTRLTAHVDGDAPRDGRAGVPFLHLVVAVRGGRAADRHAVLASRQLQARGVCTCHVQCNTGLSEESKLITFSCECGAMQPS
jgi:hypothetical protein